MDPYIILLKKVNVLVLLVNIAIFPILFVLLLIVLIIEILKQNNQEYFSCCYENTYTNVP